MKVGVVGVGALGGSIGLRARRNGCVVLGADVDARALELARELGAIDDAAALEELGGRVDVLVLAAHLEPTLREIARLRERSEPRPALSLDIASVKGPVAAAASGVKNFVPTHPLAGTERSGVGAARADLFEGCAWAYVPSGEAPLDERARSFIGSLGGVPVAMGAEEHDRIVAIASHAPQVFATCYAQRLRGGDERAERLCGPVARELLRIAGMNPAMWRDVLRANAVNVERELRALAAALLQAADDLGAAPTA